MLRLPVGLGVVFFLTASTLQSFAVPIVPDFSAAVFVPGAPITNPFLPLTPGKRLTYAGTKMDGADTILETNTFTVTPKRKTIGGVDTLVVRDVAFQDGVKIEDTLDYFAQDTNGNVWYLGEDTSQFIYDSMGNLIDITHLGTWRAGVNGALPGFAMPSLGTLGFSYFQEFAAADSALDEAVITALNQMITINLGTYSGARSILETSQINSSLYELKHYAPGIGLVRIDEEFDADLKPTFIVELQSISTVPEPGTLPVFLSGVLLLAAMAGRRHWATTSI